MHFSGHTVYLQILLSILTNNLTASSYEYEVFFFLQSDILKAWKSGKYPMHKGSLCLCTFFPVKDPSFMTTTTVGGLKLSPTHFARPASTSALSASTHSTSGTFLKIPFFLSLSLKLHFSHRCDPLVCIGLGCEDLPRLFSQHG